MSDSKDYLFAPSSGYLLTLDASTGAAVCPVSGYRKELSDMAGVKLVMKTDMADYRRRYKLEPVVRTREDEELLAKRTRATVDEPCPKCAHRQLEYYTMQLRSADEGQTVFYECVKCGHKFSQNN
ncbi:MAG: hypothetical protein WDW36_000728 [Sanguina aurantia]